MDTKTLLASTIFSIAINLHAGGAIAGHTQPQSTSCWFVRDQKLEISGNCTIESWSYAGGSLRKLTWEDGVTTSIQYGVQNHRRSVCPKGTDEIALDDVCGSEYLRYAKTFERVLKSEASRAKDTINCIEVKQRSVCWRF
jgi:hypothetical protein